jgi:hypothetical protein
LQPKSVNDTQWSGGPNSYFGGFAMPVSYSIGSIESARSSVIHEPEFPNSLLLDTNVLIDVATGDLINIPHETSVFVSSLSLVELAAPNYMDVTVAEAILNAN